MIVLTLSPTQIYLLFQIFFESFNSLHRLLLLIYSGLLDIDNKSFVAKRLAMTYHRSTSNIHHFSFPIDKFFMLKNCKIVSM